MTSTARARGLLTMLGWASLLLGAIIALGAMGRGVLSTPPLTGGLAAMRSWASTRDAATILMTGVRVGGRLLAAYLLASTALGTAARVTRWAAAVRIADAIALPPIRRLATGTAGLFVVAGPIAGAVGPSQLVPAHGGPSAPLVARVSVPPVLMFAPAPPVLVAGGPTSSSAGPASRGHFDPGDWPTLGLLPSASASPTPETWTVRPGDSLWILSQSVLRSKWGRAPTDDETGRYWVVVVAVNRARLADPANPSLLFPGQEMAIPPPPPLPAT